MSSKGAVFEKQYGDMRISIFEEMDTCIAVVHEENADANLISDALLRIGGIPEIRIYGYMDNSRAVYCCMLTEGETATIQNGADVSIWHGPEYTEKDFYGTPYAAVTMNYGHYCIIDRDGNFVVPPGNESIRRTGNYFFITEDWDKGVRVFNADTRKDVVIFDDPDEIIMPLNNTVFCTSHSNGYSAIIEKGRNVYDLETGEKIAWIPPIKNSEGNEVLQSIEGKYFCCEIGKSQRIIMEWEDGWRLTTHEGKAVSDSFQRITPLIWNQDHGVFMVESFKKEEDRRNFDGKALMEGLDGREYRGESWRCGLIDQDGNIIAEMIYVGICVGEDFVLLQKEDGMFVRVEI